MRNRLLLLLAAGAAALLCGCAGISAKVVNFNAWPADGSGATFSFITPENRVDDLEQLTYQGYVAAELVKRGLKQPPAGKTGRFFVDVATSGGTKQKTFLEPVYSNQLVFVPPFRDPNGNVFQGYWAPDQFGSRYIGDREVTRTVNVARLKVRILDTAQGAPGRPKPVFETQAVYEGDNEDLPDVVPYLTRAIFDNFPGANGRVTVVKFDPRTGEIRKQ